MPDYWDAIDSAVLTRAKDGPATLHGLADAADTTVTVMRDLVLGHVRQGYLTALVDGGVRYQLTLSGHARLTVLNRPAHSVAA